MTHFLFLGVQALGLSFPTSFLRWKQPLSFLVQLLCSSTLESVSLLATSSDRAVVPPQPPFIRDEINNAINKSIWESKNCQD